MHVFQYLVGPPLCLLLIGTRSVAKEHVQHSLRAPPLHTILLTKVGVDLLVGRIGNVRSEPAKIIGPILTATEEDETFI